MTSFRRTWYFIIIAWIERDKTWQPPPHTHAPDPTLKFHRDFQNLGPLCRNSWIYKVFNNFSFKMYLLFSGKVSATQALTRSGMGLVVILIHPLVSSYTKSQRLSLCLFGSVPNPETWYLYGQIFRDQFVLRDGGRAMAVLPLHIPESVTDNVLCKFDMTLFQRTGSIYSSDWTIAILVSGVNRNSNGNCKNGYRICFWTVPVLQYKNCNHSSNRNCDGSANCKCKYIKR